jgi:hypothetical protein
MNRRLTTHSVTLVVWTLVIALPGAAWADPIFTNFGAGSSYDITTGSPVGNGLDSTGFTYAQGDTFVSSTTANLGSIAIALSYLSVPTDPITVALMQDAGDQPGDLLESFIVDAGSLGALGTNNSPVVLTSLLNPLLTEGTRYWITVSSPVTNSIAWNLNNIGDTAEEALSSDGGATWFSPSGLTAGAFEVDPQDQSSTPKPGSRPATRSSPSCPDDSRNCSVPEIPKQRSRR